MFWLSRMCCFCVALAHVDEYLREPAVGESFAGKVIDGHMHLQGGHQRCTTPEQTQDVQCIHSHETA